MATLFTPSTTDLTNMISAAEAKFAASRKAALDDRAAAAMAANRASRRVEHDNKLVRAGTRNGNPFL